MCENTTAPKRYSPKALIVLCISVLSVVLFTPSARAAYQFGQAGTNVDSVVNAGTGLSDKGDIKSVIATVIKGLLGAVGILFFGLMLYGGFVWMTARGQEDRVTEARNTVIAATMGIAVIVASYALTTFITKKLSGGG